MKVYKEHCTLIPALSHSWFHLYPYNPRQEKVRVFHLIYICCFILTFVFVCATLFHPRIRNKCIETNQPAGKEVSGSAVPGSSLADALLSLLEERPLSEISVVNMCGACHVSRRTLSHHFECSELALLRCYAVDELQKYFRAGGPLPGPAYGAPEYFIVFFTTRSPS